jgi:hypothetical protein
LIVLVGLRGGTVTRGPFAAGVWAKADDPRSAPRIRKRQSRAKEVFIREGKTVNVFAPEIQSRTKNVRVDRLDASKPR